MTSSSLYLITIQYIPIITQHPNLYMKEGWEEYEFEEAAFGELLLLVLLLLRETIMN